MENSFPENSRSLHVKGRSALPGKVPELMSQRYMNAFVSTGKAQAAALKKLSDEVERQVRDEVLIALCKFREVLGTRGVEIRAGDVAETFSEITREPLEPSRVSSRLYQAKDRRTKRKAACTVFQRMESILEGESADASED